MRDDLDTLIGEEAYRIVRRYRGYVEPEDVRQEMWLWCSARKNYVTGLQVGFLRRRLRDVGEGYSRKEKATKTGYSPQDEAFYGLAMLRELLPVAISDDVNVLRGVNEADKPTTRRAGAAPSMDYETAVADVRKTFRLLPEWHQETLRAAAADGVTGVAVNRALRAWQRKLGGRRPNVA